MFVIGCHSSHTFSEDTNKFQSPIRHEYKLENKGSTFIMIVQQINVFSLRLSCLFAARTVHVMHDMYE